jgi:hypothetical protein
VEHARREAEGPRCLYVVPWWFDSFRCFQNLSQHRGFSNQANARSKGSGWKWLEITPGIRAALAAETSTRLGVKNWQNRETPERTDGFGVSGSEQVTLKRINSRKSERSKAPSFTVVSGGVFNFKASPMFLCGRGFRPDR